MRRPQMLLRSGRLAISPEEIERICDDLALRIPEDEICNFLDQVKLMNRIIEQDRQAGTRPIHDAADEVAETATFARAMLVELRQSAFWKILTKKPG